MITARDFTGAEITEISKYILNNVPYSILEQIFPLTENIQLKSQVFTIVYRLINSAKNNVSQEETKLKMEQLLEESKVQYEIVFTLLSKQQHNNFNNFIKTRKISNYFLNYDNNMVINNMVDIFLIFAEIYSSSLLV
jgi:hypothetical protein